MTPSTLGLALCVLCVLTAIVLRERVRSELPVEQLGAIDPLRQADKLRRLLLFPALLMGVVSLRPWPGVLMPGLEVMAGLLCVACVFTEGRACQAIATTLPQQPGRLLIASRLTGLAGMLLAVGVMTRVLG